MEKTPLSPTTSAQRHSRREGRRAAVAGAVGTIIEYYDFALYGAASALVFGPLFFSSVSPTAATLASFATFAVGFIARPIGSIAVAHFGDRIGRKPGLLFSISIMGASTVLIGFLPTYETAGIWAPLLLVLLRICQGLGAGAELAGAFTYVVEHNRNHRPAFYSSLASSGVSAGLALASLTFLAVSSLPRAELLAWGWRVPFIASIVIFAVAAYIRSQVSESPDFVEARQPDAAPQRAPLVEVFRERPAQLAIGFLALVSLFGFSYVGNTFMLSYLQNTVGMSGSAALVAGLSSTLLGIVVAPLFGVLGDRVGSAPVLAGGAIFVAVTAFPFFMLAKTGSTVIVVVALSLWYSIGWGSMSAVHGVFMARLFETRYRYTGLAVSRELPSAVVGGTAPLVASALVAVGSGEPWLVAGYVVVLSAVTVAALVIAGRLAARRSARRPFFVDL